jgi:hypothetical protein
MILHRARGGVISSVYLTVVLRAGGERRRVTSAAFRDGELDAAILGAFDLKALVEAHARETISARGLWLRRGGPPQDRPAVQRTWSFGRGDARCVWIRGRNVSAMAGDERYESAFDAHSKNGFPPKLAEALGAETVDAVRAAVEALSPLECFCGTNADRIEHWDTIETLVMRSDPRAPVDLQAAVAQCTVCHQAWTFEWGGDSHYSYTYAATPLSPNVGYEGEEIERVVAGVRAGAEVMIGVSRSHTTYRGKDGAIVAEDFDEGMTEEHACSEETLRRLIADEPESFLEVLRIPLRAKLREALLANDDGAIEALHALLSYGECLHEVEILEAALEGTSPPIDGKTGLDAYHAIMGALGYGTTGAAAGEFGLRVFASLEGTNMPRLRRYRAAFRTMTGDHAGALDDLLWEQSRMPKDDPDAESLHREIEAARATR